MAAQPVEWVLVVYYGRAAHQATYGRLGRKGYTKDFIQLSRTPGFLNSISSILGVAPGEADSVPITFRWPKGSARGDFVFKSADRPHLKWNTSEGAPLPWRMTESPADDAVETIPGNPHHSSVEDAEREFAQISRRGAGQPYLMAVKLKGEAAVFHLRVYLGDPDDKFSWADINLVPPDIQELAAATSRKRATAWSLFQSSGIIADDSVKSSLSRLGSGENYADIVSYLGADERRALREYLRQPGVGLFFDPDKNHDAWLQPDPFPEEIAAIFGDLLRHLDDVSPNSPPNNDLAAEQIEVDPLEVEGFKGQIEEGNYAVPDSKATIKTRGSAQRAFAEAVKRNYGYRCAITGLRTRDFLVASHIVPWSDDSNIRLDPSNGICLSLMVDRAFEKGYLLIDDDLTVRIDRKRIGGDSGLLEYLEAFDGKKISVPRVKEPRVDYLRRRRALFESEEEE